MWYRSAAVMAQLLVCGRGTEVFSYVESDSVRGGESEREERRQDLAG